jgi:hypothetical protein
MSATVIKMSIQRMVCTGCGAEANASCNCGVAYQPKSVRAREAVTDPDNAKKSLRAMEAETGIDRETLRRARTDTGVSVEETVGLDGKTRRMPIRDADVVEPTDPEFAKKQFVFAADSILETAKDALGYVERMQFSGNEAEELCEITWRIISQFKDVTAALTRRIPVRDAEDEDNDIETDVDPGNYLTAYMLRADAARRFATYSGSVTKDTVAMARQVAAAWLVLARKMERSR